MEECLICKAPLEYLVEDQVMECAICHKKESSKTGASTAIMFAMTAIPRAWTPSSASHVPGGDFRRPRRYPPPDDGPVLLPYARARAPCDGGSGAAHRL